MRPASSAPTLAMSATSTSCLASQAAVFPPAPPGVTLTLALVSWPSATGPATRANTSRPTSPITVTCGLGGVTAVTAVTAADPVTG